MYPYLFGNQALGMYDLLGVLGYVIILAFYFFKRNRLPTWRQTLVVMAVQLIAYTFGGVKLAGFVGRGTDFYGFLTVSALGLVLAAASFGQSPLRWLDNAVPLYLFSASVLKLSCFCGGCCNGYPFAYGLYNRSTLRTEFPIQLVELVAYGLLLWWLIGYRGRPGQRFFRCLTGYAAVRFAVQFFRADRPVFSAFHWMSAVFFALGVLGLVLVSWWSGKTKTPSESM